LVAERDELLRLKSFALDRVREAVYLIDRNARFIYVNEEACRSLGYEGDELRRMTVMDIDPAWGFERWETAWADLRVRGSVMSETAHRRKDGSLLSVEVSTSYFESAGKEYNLSIARDITSHKQAQALLTTQLELEAQFRSLAETTPDIIARYDRACRLVYANSGLEATLCIPLRDMLGKTPVERTPGPQAAVYQALVASVIETGEERDIELELPVCGNGTRHHHIRIIAERGIDGEIIGVLALGRDITERKREQERLHASEQAFRAVVEHSPDYIARYDLSYRRVYVNPATLKFVHRSFGELLGTTPGEYSSLVDVDAYTHRLRQAAETGKEVADEVRYRDAEGQIRWGHMRIVPEFAPNGQVASLLAIGRDVDELKRSEQRFRTLTENFPDFIARFDKECRYIYVNPAVSKAFGIAQGDFIGKRLHELAATSEAGQNERLEAGVRRAFAEGVPNEREVEWQTEKGCRVLEVRYVPEKDEEGTVVSVLAIARDITRLRMAELALSDSERAFRTLAENAPDPIIRYDRALRRIYVNPEFLRVTGLKAPDVLGKSILETSDLPARVVKALARTLDKVIECGNAAKGEFTWERRGKPTCWFVHAVPEYDADGRVQSVLTVWRDITESKAAEHRLRESYEMLRALASRRETTREEERKRIARELHDELGQQLTALRMGASALRMRFVHDNPVVADDIQKLLVLADKTMQVVRDVVASLRPAVLDAGIVAALEWLGAEFSRNSNAICHLCVPEEHVSLGEDVSIAFFRIVQEALTNVVRHARAKHVFITLDYSDDHCVLDIRDDGAGFNPVARRRRKSFGLAGMKERVLMVGGEIVIGSSPGKGTAITVRVPMCQAAGAS
jgi:PAS domain S-box-containing protein